MQVPRSRLFRTLASLALALGVAASGLAAQQGTATVTGVVTDASTQQAIQGAQVVVAGTNLSALSNQSGRYLILNVPVGSRDIRVQLLGYAASSQSVTLTAGASAVADFSLSASAIELEGLTVNTITGKQQRAREIGTNSTVLEVATDIIPAAVTSITDILSGRAEGVVLQDMGGTVGSSQRIRIRGANSVSLSNEPLIYIDGVRMNSTIGEGLIGVGGQRSSRLNDINPNDIANIEVLKGPAASALYGTAAANGVLLITTKRGSAGTSQWDFYSEYGVLADVTDYGTSYVSNSIVDASAPFILNNAINTTAYPYCTNRGAAAGDCTQDLSQDFNALLDPRTRPFNEGFQRKFGVTVSGGNERMTYFISGEISDEQGVIDFNLEDKFNVRANFSSAIRDDLDAFVTFGYTSSQLDLSSNDNSIFSPIINGVLGQGVYFAPTAEEPDQVNRANLGFAFNQTDLQHFVSEEDVDRFVLGINSSYRPLTWLTANVNIGLDQTFQHNHRTLQPDLLPIAASFAIGRRQSDRTTASLWTGNSSLTATREVNDWIQSTSTGGISFQKTRRNRTECFGAGLVQGTASCGTTSSLFSVDEDFFQDVTVGGFFQQTFGLWDRLFLAGSVRGDDNSAFGELSEWEYYPSASVSWVAGEEEWFPDYDWIGDFRVRAAYGTSGLRPGFRSATTAFSPVAVRLGGVESSGVSLSTTGNDLLKPERTTEYELGLDAGLFNDRIGVHYTYFTKTSTDALVSRQLAPSLGLTGSVFENLGEVQNTGHEIGVNLGVLDTPDVGLDIDVTASFFDNVINDLGEGTGDIIFNRGFQRHQVGRPASAFFQREIIINDADGNGKLTNSEVTLGDTAVYLGNALPTWQSSVNVGIRLFDFARISTLFEGRGGNLQGNDTEAFYCGFRSTRGCGAVGNPNASLEEQGRYIADRFLGSAAGFAEDASFVRWRELAVTLRAPASLSRRFAGLDGLSLTVAGRNLNIWTDYGGIDPETVENPNGSNGNRQSEFNTQPPVRSFVFRLNYSF